jgi:hypothetical protein
VFYFTQELKADSTVNIVGDGYEYYFYNVGNDNKAVTVYYDFERESQNLVHIVFNLIPKNHTRIDSLSLGFNDLLPSTALLLEDPSGNYTIPYSYAANYGDSAVTINFSNFNVSTNEQVKLELWIDTTQLNPNFNGQFVMSFATYSHEDSLFKIWRYHGQSAVQLSVPS